MENERGNIQSLLKRAFIFLEYSEWDNADKYFENVLDIDPENGKAYLGKVLVKFKIKDITELEELERPFYEDADFKRALRYLDEEEKNKLYLYKENAVKIIEEKKNEKIYSLLEKKMTETHSESYYLDMAEEFRKLNGYKNSVNLAGECVKLAQMAREAENEAEEIYNSVIAAYKNSNKNSDLLKVKKEFENIKGYKDTEEIINDIDFKLKSSEEKIKNKTDKRKKIFIGLVAIVRAVFLSVVAIKNYFIPNSQYQEALREIEKGNTFSGVSILQKLDDFSDSKEVIFECLENEPALMVQSTGAGQTAIFGSYEQDGNLKNGKEPIEWIVVERDYNSALLLSKDCLAAMKYSSNDKNEWKDSIIYEYLTNEFYNEAFNIKEQKCIIKTLQCESDSKKIINEDKITLMSNGEETFKYGECGFTNYAKEFSDESSGWWLYRSPNEEEYLYVDSNNKVSIGNHDDVKGIRPVICVEF